MASCKASGKVKNRPFKMKMKGIRRRDPNKSNKHRLVPAKLRGFHENSIQLNMNRKGMTGRYNIDKYGTIRRLLETKEEVGE